MLQALAQKPLTLPEKWTEPLVKKMSFLRMVREKNGRQFGGIAGCGRRHTNKGLKRDLKVCVFFPSLQFKRFVNRAVECQLWMMAEKFVPVLFLGSIFAGYA